MAATRTDLQHVLDFSEITDSMMMAILVYHNNSRQLVYMNKIAEETLEFPDSSALSELFLERLYPEDGSSRGRCFSGDFVHDAGFYQDIMMKRFNGTNFIANLGVRLIQDANYTVLMFQDVSFQKKLQREVQVKQQELMRSYTEILEQNAELQSLSEAKDKLITLSSHELRTPLSAIIAMTESLKLGVIEDPEELKSYYNDIHSEGQSLMNIVNSMLEVLKFTTKKMPFFINENELVSFVKEKVDSEFNAKGIDKKINYSGLSEVKAYFDTIQLKKAILLVVDNAVKHCPSCDSISLKFEESEEFAILKVRDRGPGIDESYHEQIFNEFTTLGNIDTHSKGAGLSLTIVKLSTEQQGGKVYINPKYTDGTEMVFEIPKNKVLDEDCYSDFNPYEDIEF